MAASNHTGSEDFKVLHHAGNILVNIELKGNRLVLRVHAQFGYCYGILDPFRVSDHPQKIICLCYLYFNVRMVFNLF